MALCFVSEVFEFLTWLDSWRSTYGEESYKHYSDQYLSIRLQIWRLCGKEGRSQVRLDVRPGMEELIR